jgi:hypothetical protein
VKPASPTPRAYFQDGAPVRAQRTLDGHAVRAIFFATGVADLALETGDGDYRLAIEKMLKAADFLAGTPTSPDGWYPPMMNPSVAVVRGEHPSEMVKEALQLVRADGLVLPDDVVLMKPNYVSAKSSATGVTTDAVGTDQQAPDGYEASEQPITSAISLGSARPAPTRCSFACLTRDRRLPPRS